MAYLALDQGTTSSRAFVFDEKGAVLAQAQRELASHFPSAGRVEHDAHEIFEGQWQVALAAHRQAGEPSIQAVGIANQRETVVVFEKATGKPIHRAIVWQDRRTARELEKLVSAGHGERVRDLTGLPLDPYFSAAKIAWILDAVPGARAAAEKGELGAATMDAWLLYRLSGGEAFATEPGNASRTSLFDLQEGAWSDELCQLFAVPRACLPEIRPSAGRFGEVLATGWPITGMLGDQQAALFGQGCFTPGEAKCTLGTGAFLLVHAGTRPPRPGRGLLATVAWRLEDTTHFALEGSVLVSGALIQWLRDGLGIIHAADEVEALARSVEHTGGLVIVPAFAGLGTPHWDADARGLVIGITRGTGRGEIARAALEAMALQVREVQLATERVTGAPLRHLRVDGGAARNDLLLEILASLCGVKVLRPACTETTAVGACRIAMLGAKAAASPGGLPALPSADTEFEPKAALAKGLWPRWREAVARCRGWARAL